MNIFDNIDADNNHPMPRLDGAPRSSGAKQPERDCLASEVEQFLAFGGRITTIPNGVSAYHSRP